MSEKNQTQFYFFSGKGGTGKTSVACATALWLAGRGSRTLVISIDPAHSLSDSFEKRVGGEVRRIGKNLWGLEMDPAKAAQEYKQKLMPSIGGSGLAKSMGLEDVFDIAGMTPGIDEIAAFDKFLGYVNSDEYDAVVFDTAPTGHALRFLSLPDVLDTWIGRLIRVRMQLSGIAGLVRKFLPFGGEENRQGFGLEQLEGMKSRIAVARGILSDSKRTHFNLVLIPEEMSIFESIRSLEALRVFGIRVESVIVNNIVPASSTCEFCRSRRAVQLKRLKTVETSFRGCRIRKLRLFPREVKGRRMLEAFACELYGN